MAKAKASSKKTTKRNDRMGVIIAVIAVALIAIVGTSFAFFTQQLNGEKENVIEVGTLTLELDETSAKGVEILNAVPVTKSYALANYDSYTFDLKNIGTVEAAYEITLDAVAQDKQLPNDKIRYQLSKSINGAEAVVTEGLLSAITEDGVTTLDAGKIAANETKDSTIAYTLYLWVDQDAEDEVEGTKYVGKISVDAIQSYGTE